MEEYTLRYCYKYEPGFDVFTSLDIILYKESDESSSSIYEYLKKEDELIDREDEYQIFFRTNHFQFRKDATKIQFIELQLFPQKAKDDSVMNLIYIPLKKEWTKMTNIEQLIIIDEEIKKQQKEVDFLYKLVNYTILDIDVENQLDEVDDDFSKADELE